MSTTSPKIFDTRSSVLRSYLQLPLGCMVLGSVNRRLWNKLGMRQRAQGVPITYKISNKNEYLYSIHQYGPYGVFISLLRMTLGSIGFLRVERLHD